MHREIVLKGKTIPYTLKLSKRAKYVNLTVLGSGELVVSLPHRLTEEHSKNFILEKQDWIYKNLKRTLDVPQFVLPKQNEKEMKFHKDFARIYINKKIVELNKKYNFAIKNVFIKNQKSQWGSCSSKGNLNYNYKLIFLPKELAEYVILHEMCHLKEFNHSKNFWSLIEQTVPEPKKIDKMLHNYHLV